MQRMGNGMDRIRRCENCGVNYDFKYVGWMAIVGDKKVHYVCSGRCGESLDRVQCRDQERSALDLETLEVLKAVISLFEPRAELPKRMQERFRRLQEQNPVLIRVRAAIARVEAARAGPSYGVPPAASVVSDA